MGAITGKPEAVKVHTIEACLGISVYVAASLHGTCQNLVGFTQRVAISGTHVWSAGVPHCKGLQRM